MEWCSRYFDHVTRFHTKGIGLFIQTAARNQAVILWNKLHPFADRLLMSKPRDVWFRTCMLRSRSTASHCTTAASDVLKCDVQPQKICVHMFDGSLRGIADSEQWCRWGHFIPNGGIQEQPKTWDEKPPGAFNNVGGIFILVQRTAAPVQWVSFFFLASAFFEGLALHWPPWHSTADFIPERICYPPDEIPYWILSPQIKSAGGFYPPIPPTPRPTLNQTTPHS